MPKRKRSEQRRSETLDAAEMVFELINMRAVPDFLTEAMIGALGQAAAVKKINLWGVDGTERNERGRISGTIRQVEGAFHEGRGH